MKKDKATVDNRAYLASCLRHSTQIPLWGTSDTPKTLGDMASNRKDSVDK
jgi:hypothetical protein